jgi:NAD(P)H-dependent FMN reductase
MALSSPIFIIAGTNRPNSRTLKLADILLGHYSTLGVSAEVYSLTELPMEIFSPAAYAVKPAEFIPIQQRVLSASGLHVVTPEYNGSFPGALKYFIDMLKFPESFQHKPVAFTGCGGMFGALRPVEQLQHVFGYRNAYVYPDRVFVPSIARKFDEKGKLIDDAINQRLAVQADGFATFVGKLKTA